MGELQRSTPYGVECLNPGLPGAPADTMSRLPS